MLSPSITFGMLYEKTYKRQCNICIPKSGINQIFLYFFFLNGKRLAVNSNILKNSIHSVINFSRETYSHAKKEEEKKIRRKKK